MFGPANSRPTTTSTSDHVALISEAIMGIALPFAVSLLRIAPLIFLPTVGNASATVISNHTSMIFESVGNQSATTVSNQFLFLDFETVVTLFAIVSIALCFLRCFRLPCKLFTLITNSRLNPSTGTVEVDPEVLGLRSLILSIHGMGYKDTFRYNDVTNIHDLQHHIRRWFKQLCVSDTFRIEHESNRFPILNTKGRKRSVKLKELNLSPNWLTIIPSNFLIPVSGGAAFNAPNKGRKRGNRQSNDTRRKKKRKLNGKQYQKHQDNIAEAYQQRKEDVAAAYQQRKDQIQQHRKQQRIAKKESAFEETRNSFRITGDIDEADFPVHYLGRMDQKCVKCGAMMFEGEKLASGKGFSLCCGNGKVLLPKLKRLPNKLTEYLTATTKEAKYFRKNIRSINAAFAFASLGVNDKTLPGGSFKIQGNVCHRMNETFSSQSDVKFASIYFYDNDNELDNRLKFSHAPKGKVGKKVFQEVQTIVHKLSPFYKEFKSAVERQTNEPLKSFRIVLRADIKPEKAHKGCYNAPNDVCQVAAIIPGHDREKQPREIVLYCKPALSKDDMCVNKNGKEVQKQVFISEGHPYYDPTQYVTMFPYGTLGWAPDTFFTQKGFENHENGDIDAAEIEPDADDEAEIGTDREECNGEENAADNEEENEGGERPESEAFIRNLRAA